MKCIECEASVNELFKVTADEYIKLTVCKECHLVADPYVECESSVVFMDLLLLRTAAFRHCLHNSTLANSKETVLKLLICTVICRGYFHYWSSSVTAMSQELIFYKHCLAAFLDVLGSALLLYTYSNYKKSNIISIEEVFRCMALGSFPAVLHVPATVWSVAQYPLYTIAATLYSVVAAAQSLRGTVSCGRLEAGCIAMLCTAAPKLLYSAVTQLLPSASWITSLGS